VRSTNLEAPHFSSCYLLGLIPKYLLHQHPNSNIPTSAFNVKNQVSLSLSHKQTNKKNNKNRKIIVLYILTFTVSGTRGEDKRFWAER
jgi:hypothetical protein